MKAFLFAGQGTQHAGMGRDLYEKFPEFRAVYDQAKLDFDLKKLSFEDPDSLINQTEYTQPVLCAFALGLNEILRKRGIRPDYAAGLSLGEYSALECAGVLTPEETIEAVAFRGRAMAKASEGTDCGMSAVIGLPEAALQRCCEEASADGIVSICNYNCPGQLVIGGEKKAVAQASALAKAAGARRVIPLKVSGPFHTAIMKPAGDALREYFESIPFAEPEFPVLYNYLGRTLEPDERDEEGNVLTIPRLLELQVQRPVRMEKTIRALLNAGVDTFVEIGPGRVLSGFVKKTVKAAEAEEPRIISLESAEEVEAYLSEQ